MSSEFFIFPSSSFSALRNQHRDPFTTGSLIKKTGDVRDVRVAQCGHYFSESEDFITWSNNKDAQDKIQCPCCRKSIRSAFASGFAVKSLLAEQVDQARNQDRLLSALDEQERKVKWQSIGMQIGQERLNNLADKVDELVTQNQALELEVADLKQENGALKGKAASEEAKNQKLIQERDTISSQLSKLLEHSEKMCVQNEKMSVEYQEMRVHNQRTEQRLDFLTNEVSSLRKSNKKKNKKLKKQNREIKKLEKKSKELIEQNQANTIPTICSLVSRMFN